MAGPEISRRWLLQGAAIFGGVAAVSACGGGGSVAGSTGGGGGGGSALTVAAGDFAGEQFDPVVSVSFDRVLAAMFEAPFRVSTTGAASPGIVESYSHSADGSAWTMHMRDDVVFHDGSKCTSADLAFAYERSIAADANNQGDWLPILGKTPKIDIVDDYTIIVHTIGPQPTIIPLSTILEGGVWLVPKAYITKHGIGYFNTKPIGTGPYEFVNHVHGESIEMKAVSYKHWRVNPQLSPLTFKLIPNDSTAIAELESGGVDSISVSPQDAVTVSGRGYGIADFAAVQVNFAIVGAYTPQEKGKPLSDVRVRQALSLAIDRETVIKTVLKGRGAATGPFRVGLNMPDVTASLRQKWTAWSNENYVYDPDKAKSLLAAAGYPKGFSFPFWSQGSSPDIPYLPDVAQVLASFWQEIGINPSIVTVTNELYGDSGNPSTSTKGIGAALLGSTSMAKPSAVENLASFYATGEVFDNLYGSPEQAVFDKAYNQANAALDSSPYLDQMIEVSTSTWTGIPIVLVPSLNAYNKKFDPAIPQLTYSLGDTYADWKLAAK